MWKSIIKNKELINSTKDKIEVIHSILKGKDLQNISLFEGQAGKILFETMFTVYKKLDLNTEEISKDLNLIYSRVDDLEDLSLSRGLAGIFYLKDYLNRCNIVEFENDDDEVDIAEFYANKVSEEVDLDYLHGMSGVVLSELEGKKEINCRLMDMWLQCILKKNEDNLVNEIKWKVNSEQAIGGLKKVYSLGLAHGTPSLILILLKLYKKRGGSLEKEIMDKSVNFLLGAKYSDDFEFRFPNQIVDGEKTRGRLAWCYGDLGCAIALFHYGHETKNQNIIKFSESVFDLHLNKRDVEKYNVLDPDFCHGSIGIAHIYARMYNYTNYERYREYSEYWYKTTLEKATFYDGLAGYKHYTGDKGYLATYGLLEGIAGIGLSLISAISDNEPKWDSCLLLSC